MSVVNKRERLSSRWRFWLGYILSLLVVSAIVYFALGAAERSEEAELTELQRLRNRNSYWEKMANLTANIDKYEGLALKGNSDDNYELKNLESKIDEEIKLVKGELNTQLAVMELPDKVLEGLNNYYSLVKLFKEQVEELTKNIEEAKTKDCAQELKDLKKEHKDEIKDLKTEITLLKMQLQ